MEEVNDSLFDDTDGVIWLPVDSTADEYNAVKSTGQPVLSTIAFHSGNGRVQKAFDQSSGQH